MSSIRVWDAPLRCFHWALAACVLGAFVTVKVGGNMMIWHERFGLAIVALIAFRLTWGLVGPRHARFMEFLPTPSRLTAYFHGQWQGAGHNPLGALSVLALLGLFALQGITGLFAYDDISFGGPLRRLVSSATVERLTSLHHAAEPWLLALVALHLLAILFYRLRGQKLVGPMLHGRKPVPPARAEDATGRVRPLALGLALLVAALALWGASGGWISAPLPAPPAAAPAW